MLKDEKKSTKLSAIYAGGIILTGAFIGAVGFATYNIVDNMKQDTIANIQQSRLAAAEAIFVDGNGNYYLPDNTVVPASNFAGTVTETVIPAPNEEDVIAEDEAVATEASSEEEADTELENDTESDDNEKSDKKSKKDSKDKSADETSKKFDNKNIEMFDDGTAVYHIQKGDTLSYVSSVVGYSVDELAEYNSIDNVNVIYAGSAIRIPLD